MSKWFKGSMLSLILILVATILPVHATTIEALNLAQMCQRAGIIVDGTIVAVETSSIQVGGGELETIKYTLRASRVLKGKVPAVKDQKILSFEMVGLQKSTDRLQVLKVLDMPELEEGERYLLFLTEPSSAGLSTTLGLKQGSFTVIGDPLEGSGKAMVLNGFNNVGLFRNMDPRGLAVPGPIQYNDLVNLIKELVDQN